MRRLFLAFVLVGCVMSAGLLAGTAVVNGAWAKGASRYTNLDTMAQALHHIERNFVDGIGPEQLIYGAIKGMTEVLDDHSVFLTPEEMSTAEVRTEGWYTGIGVELGEAPGGARITRVIPDGPAMRAGIKVGERIVDIDGVALTDLSLKDINEKLRGEDGSQVELTLRFREVQRRVVVQRLRVRDKSVSILPGTPGYPTVRIDHFQRNTADDLETALTALARRKGQARGLVIDLRDNPGGLLDEAAAVVDIFLDNGLIYEIRGREGQTETQVNAKPGSRWERIPIVVLVNHGSASASEIVAGALQAHGRAKVVGASTYGKGSVQRMYVFEDGSGLRLTVSRYFLHGGREVKDKMGLIPDVEVSTPTEKTLAAQRLQVLASELPNQSQREEADTLIRQLLSDKDAPAEQRSDLQLEAAWKTIRATP